MSAERTLAEGLEAINLVADVPGVTFAPEHCVELRRIPARIRRPALGLDERLQAAKLGLVGAVADQV